MVRLQVARDLGVLAQPHEEVVGPGPPVAVHHETRVALQHQVGVQARGEPVGHPGRADVVGDVPVQIPRRDPEGAEAPGKGPARVLAGEEERRAPARAHDLDGIRIVGAEELPVGHGRGGRGESWREA